MLTGSNYNKHPDEHTSENRTEKKKKKDAGWTEIKDSTETFYVLGKECLWVSAEMRDL